MHSETLALRYHLYTSHPISLGSFLSCPHHPKMCSRQISLSSFSSSILLRSENDGASTGVDAICTYHPDPTEPELDNEQIYGELSELTNNITQLGPYTLDQNSLYINGE